MAKNLLDAAAEVRVQKVGPYTVTVIGGPEEYKLWKQRRAEKEVIWQKEYEARLALRKSNALGILEGTAAPSKPDYAEEIQRRFKESQARQAAAYAQSMQIAKASTPPLVISSKFSRVISAIKEFFEAPFRTKL